MARRMSRILAFDTAGPVVGVALLSGDVIRTRTERSVRGAESRLVPWMLALLEEAGHELSELDGIAVANGPGAFTGLRVGLATAIGIAISSDKLLYPCSSLRSRAERARQVNGGAVLATLDARKLRVYAALYDPNGELTCSPGDVPPEVAASWASPGTLVTGEGALAYRDAFEAAGLMVDPLAEEVAVGSLARLAAAALGSDGWVDPAEVAPVYLRPPDAQKPKPGKLARIRR
jgi:tRNA threonylcarbamoyladenosine biosynthesis protein TsaB